MKRALVATLLSCFVVVTASPPARAADISFDLSSEGSELTVVNRGTGTAFYAAAFLLLPDGRWTGLGARDAPAQLPPDAHSRFAWPDEPSGPQRAEIEHLRPLMVRFFDQSGIGFGQIAFLSPPPVARSGLHARYAGGALLIEPPTDAASAIRATWVLWAREDGIDPIRLPVRFVHEPPPAQRIVWRERAPTPYRLDTGARQPSVILLHETEQGFEQQFVPQGSPRGREQRAAWLEAAPQLYAAALLALLLAVGATARSLFRRPVASAAATKARA